MKVEFKEMHIVCENLEQRKTVISHLIGFGYTSLTNMVNDRELCVATYTDGDFQATTCVNNQKRINYKDFMEKYAMTGLKNKVQEALSKGYTNQSLSLALGHNKKYISNALTSSSERAQKTIVAKIDYLLNSTVIQDAVMISKEEYNALTSIRYEKERVEREYSEFQVERDSCVKQFNHDIEKLEKELNHKNQVLDKRNDKYNMLEAELHETKTNLIECDVYCQKLESEQAELLNEIKDLKNNLFGLTSDIQDISSDNLKLKNDYHERASMHITAENELKKQRKRYLIVLIILYICSLLSLVLSRL